MLLLKNHSTHRLTILLRNQTNNDSLLRHYSNMSCASSSSFKMNIKDSDLNQKSTSREMNSLAHTIGISIPIYLITLSQLYFS